MKILILGGTGFVGRILTENLIKKGLEPVLFNRGKRNTGIFPGLRRIYGDRLGSEINEIAKESWDAVVDFSGQFPDNIEMIARMLKGKAGRYIFVSSASAYYLEDEEKLKDPIKEEFEVYPCTAEQRKDPDVLATYSQKKAECERELLKASEWMDVIIFRPALIYGRYDPSDRFYYWLYRSKLSGEILIPDNGSTRTTGTYSEDFALLLEKALTIEKHSKIYNAVTHFPVSIKEIIRHSASVLETNPKLITAPRQFFTENNVQPWGDVPLWLGGPDLVMDNSKVINEFKVEFQPFESSIRGCAEYYSALGWAAPSYGLSLDKERELIDILKAGKQG